MKNLPWMGLALAFAISLAASQAQAQAKDGVVLSDLASRSERYSETHVIAEDGTEVASYSLATKVLKPEALESLKNARLSYSASAQKLEVGEAYTRKADGRRIKVPPANFQVRTAGGKSGAAAVFSDWNETTVVFPDLAVGDAVVLSYKIITKIPLFPGKVSNFGSFARQTAYDDVRIVFDIPASLAVRHQARHMKLSDTLRGKRRLLEFSWQNKQPVRSERFDYSVYDPEFEPGYAFSSFQSYQEIAQRYVERATVKAALTPRLRQLADKLTEGSKTPADQVKALYTWVATEITYAGNCVGIGAVVPRDLDFVLDNRMGDCKDHATLLEALLAAKGIASHQVLINAGNLYKLPEVPVLSLVNHVITYVPDVGLFLDSTDPDSPYGELPIQAQDKPVLAAVTGLPARTPPDPGRSSQLMKTTMEIAADGSVSGRVEVQASGQFGLEARRQFKSMSKDTAATLIKQYFASMQMEGEGQITYSDPKPLGEHQDYQADFKISKLFRMPGSGAFGIAPVLFSTGPVARFAQSAVAPLREHSSLCMSGKTSEQYQITLPEKVSILAVPEGIAFSNALLSYESQYRLDGRVLHVSRKLEDHLPANVCDAETLQRYKAAIEPVWNDLRQQLLYR